MSGTVKTKDIKTIWARSAGLCSMPDCRRKLTLDNHEETATMALGEMCHIVGETQSKKSPRGISKLAEEDRNEYSNLILLCSHHHTVIDKNIIDWPVEILHKIKVDHETWVDETLTTKKLTPEEVIYSTIVDNLNETLKLNSWNSFISGAVTNIIHRNYLETLEFINERQLAIIWPEVNLEFELSIKNLMSSFTDYMNNFLKYSTIDVSGIYLKEDNHFKKIFPNPDYNLIIQRNMLWIHKNYHLLCKFTCYLNEFSKQVRQYLNPLFYLTKGNFLIIDELGTNNGGEGYLMLPVLELVNKRLIDIEIKIQEFERQNKRCC